MPVPPRSASAEVTGHVPGQGSLPALLHLKAPFRALWSVSDLLTYIWQLGQEADLLCQRSSFLLRSEGGRRERGGKCSPDEGPSVLGFGCWLCQGGSGTSAAPRTRLSLFKNQMVFSRAKPASSVQTSRWGGGCGSQNVLRGRVELRLKCLCGPIPTARPSSGVSHRTVAIPAARHDRLHRPRVCGAERPSGSAGE